MPNTKPWSSVRGRRMRVTKLDECCGLLAPAAPCAMLVSKGFVSVQYEPEVEAAQEIQLKNAGGELCIDDQGCDEIKWMNVEMQLCGVDPDMFTFLTGSPLVLDWQGNAVGNRIKKGLTCNVNFGMEVWTDIPQDDCVAGQKPYGYFLVPCVGKGRVGQFTIQNDALTMTITAKARNSTGWGVGPYLVDATDAANTAGPLIDPIEADDLMDLHLTTIAPPEPTDGCQPMPAAIVP